MRFLRLAVVLGLIGWGVPAWAAGELPPPEKAEKEKGEKAEGAKDGSHEGAHEGSHAEKGEPAKGEKPEGEKGEKPGAGEKPEGGGAEEPRKGGGLKQILQDLNLSEDQQAKVKDARKAGQDDEKAAQDKAMTLRKELFSLLGDKASDDKAIDAKVDAYVAALAEREKAHIAFARRLREILTPEQLKALSEKLGDMHQGGGGRPKGPDGKKGGEGEAPHGEKGPKAGGEGETGGEKPEGNLPPEWKPGELKIKPRLEKGERPEGEKGAL